MNEDEDFEEQDEEDDEDDEEAEEDKGDGSTHSIVVADSMKPHMHGQENEKPSRTQRTKPDEPGEDEGKCEGDQDEEKRGSREGSRIPAYHIQIRDQTKYGDRRRLIWSIGGTGPRKQKTTKPCQAHELELAFTQANRRHT